MLFLVKIKAQVLRIYKLISIPMLQNYFSRAKSSHFFIALALLHIFFGFFINIYISARLNKEATNSLIILFALSLFLLLLFILHLRKEQITAFKKVSYVFIFILLNFVSYFVFVVMSLSGTCGGHC